MLLEGRFNSLPFFMFILLQIMKNTTKDHIRELLDSQYNSLEATRLHLVYQRSLSQKWRVEPNITDEDMDGDIKSIYAASIIARDILTEWISHFGQ